MQLCTSGWCFRFEVLWRDCVGFGAVGVTSKPLGPPSGRLFELSRCEPVHEVVVLVRGRSSFISRYYF